MPVIRCCHGNGLNAKIDNQNINLVSTLSMLVNFKSIVVNDVPFMFKPVTVELRGNCKVDTFIYSSIIM